MDWKLKILGLFVMMALVVAFIVCWRSETFHRLASPEEKVVITEEMKLCLDCHQEKYTPFVFKSWKKSKHALRGIGCNMCHVTGNNDLKQEIERVAKERGVGESKCEVKKVNHVVPPKVCAQCHEKKANEFFKSKHGKAWSGGIKMHQSLDKEGKILDMKKDCASCHQVEFKCNTCHRTHNFSLAEARKPESCGKCHSGERHGQLEQYINSTRHGLLYKSEGRSWKWTGSSEEWHKEFKDNANAPVCVTCHMPGGIHNVQHPEMKEPGKWICSECHARRDEFQLHAINHDSKGAQKYAHDKAMKASKLGMKMCVACHPGNKDKE